MPDFDVAILGGGPAGYVAAIRGAQLGGRVCVIEPENLGGTCVTWGCIPTKTLIASAHVLKMARRAKEFGVIIDGTIRPDFPGMMARKDRVVDGLVKGVEGLFKSYGITRIKGRGRLTGPGRLKIDKVSSSEDGPGDVTAGKIIIATGSRPAQFPAFPSDGKHILTSDDAMRLKNLPKSFLIIGAGIIGCEFAFLLRTLGCEITMVEMLHRALATEDEDISKILERELKKEKIKLIVNERIEKVDVRGGGVVARLKGGDEIKAEKALVSIGRAFNTDEIGLEAVGVSLAKNKSIAADSKMETNVPGIYAAGDVAGGKLLAHKGSAEGIVAVSNALGVEKEMNYLAVPAGIFTHPEVGSVGLTEAQAREGDRPVKVGRFLYRAIGKPHATGELVGEVKIVADERTGEILGAHIIGESAADLIHEATLAMRWELTVEELAETIHVHPTVSEALMEAAHAVQGMSLHQPKAAGTPGA